MSNAAPSTAERIETDDLTVLFDDKLCIHSRFCVLQAPQVFLANTPGAWIHPDRMDTAALAAVARNCPSGAVAYEAREARLNETAPPVNLLRLREDGPYALNAEIHLPDGEVITRRTLCRCGASRNKPFCDGSHVAAGFKATGEPAAGTLEPLATRGGPVAVRPMPDGPLELQGSLEMVSGTGRTFERTVHVLLCRCGGSSAKPFCDGAHSLNGFSDTPGAPPPLREPPAAAPDVTAFAGGPDLFAALTERFYAKVPDDPLLAPVFAGMDPRHAEHVAAFLAEVFGGPTLYTEQGGSHVGMIVRHLGRRITVEQRARWVELMMETAADVGLPVEPAFLATFANYLDWGSTLAVINSAEGVQRPEGDWPMPHWGWGPAAPKDPA